MKIPTLTGTIDRRILINYQAEESVLKKFLPAPFKPKLVNGKGMVGICLIRLHYVRFKGFPKLMGVSSENGAHRIAVEWEENGALNEGVFVPRRDTSSILNTLVGGRIFPGVHYHADFKVKEQNGVYDIAFESEDKTSLAIQAQETQQWNPNSIFATLEEASAFFKKGSVGYSPDRIGETFEGLSLKTYQWEVSPLQVNQVTSSFFENEAVFPKGSIQFDNALLMKNIDHEWESTDNINQTKP